MATIFLLLCLHCLLFYIAKPQSPSIYRLPSTIHPLQYDLTLFPHLSDLAAFSFDGWLRITMNISRQHVSQNISSYFNFQLNKGINLSINQSDIVLNLTVLQHQQTSFVSLSTNEVTEITTFYFNVTNNEILSLMRDSFISHFTAYFYISFSAPLVPNERRGLYLSSYEYNGTIIHGTATQFEPTYCRRALPLFDEPHWRAIFYVTYIAPIDCITLSNMDIEQVINYPDATQYECPYISSKGSNTLCKMVKFLATPPMPSYLLAFVVGEYHHLEHTQINKQLTPNGEILNFTLSVWFRLSSSEYFYAALNYSVSALLWFEDKFEVTYNLNKLDCVAVVEYGGGMENWGLIIYGGNALLIDQNIDNNPSSLRPTFGIIGHEIAHQWFGNAVTLQWWNHLWIQEGFARYFEYIVGDALRPDLPFLSTFYGSIWEGALRRSESIFAVAAIRQNVETQTEIAGQFDGASTYSKGAAIAKFINNYIGDELFYQGLNEFFVTYYYSLYTTDTFLAIFDPLIHQIDAQYNEEPMLATKMFGSYVKQAGIPILFVSFDEVKRDSIIISVSQSRMVLEGPQFYDSNHSNVDYVYYDPVVREQFGKQRWYIPYRIELANGEILQHFPFNASLASFEIDRVIDNGLEYYLFNPNTDFFFRTVYDEKSFNFILDSFEKLSYLSQYNIVSDQWRLMRSNYVSSALYLRFIQKIATPDLITEEYWNFFWNTIINSLTEIDNVLCEYHIISATNQTLIEYRKNYRFFVRRTLEALWKQLGDDWHIDEEVMSTDFINLKRKLITTFIQIGDADIIESGLNILLNSNYENSSLLPQIFMASFASLNGTVYDLIINDIFPQSSSNQQNAILAAIGMLYADEYLVQNAYNFIKRLTNNGQRNSGYRNLRLCAGRGIVWNNMMMNDSADWLDYYAFNGGNAMSFPETFASSDVYRQVYTFYVERGLLNNTTIETNQTLEKIYTNIQWISSNEQELIAFLEEFVEANDKKEVDWLPIAIYSIMGTVVLFVIVGVFCFVIRKKKKKAVESIKYNEMDQLETNIANNLYGAAVT